MASDDSNAGESANRRGNHDIFISYSRRDQSFVRALYAALEQAGHSTWVDWEGIPAIAEWRPEIFASIEAAHNFIFVLSPHAVASQVCQEELNHAIQHNKRLIPLVYQEVNSINVHPELNKLNWIFFRESDDFEKSLKTLLAAIDTDLNYVRMHTRLLVRSREWEAHAYDTSFLLRGRDLEMAEQWLRQAMHSPTPTELQRRYITTSHKVETEQIEADLKLRHLTPQQYRNRQALLSKVHHFWIKTVLESSLHGRAWLELGLVERLDAIARPWDIAWAPADQTPQPLPATTRVVDLFDQMGEGRSLLILGEPGAGKTTTLLELARELIKRSEKSLDLPIPVVFNLSSWAVKRGAIADWLVDELNTKYQVPKKIAEPWVKEQQLLLLLDGLDEVQTTYRDACVQAINQFNQQHSTEMVVCSRIKDYEDLSNRFQFQGAVYLRPLDRDQIQIYFDKAGSELAVLNSALQKDPVLQELAQSPLMLTIMTLAYQGISAEELPTLSLEDQRKYLFDTYIERMFDRRKTKHSYAKDRMKQWLIWLAQHLVQEAQTIFLIERLQPTWLQTSFQTWIYTILTGFSFAAIVGLATSPAVTYFLSSMISSSNLFELDASVVFTAAIACGAMWSFMPRWLGSTASKPFGAALFMLFCSCLGGITLGTAIEWSNSLSSPPFDKSLFWVVILSSVVGGAAGRRLWSWLKDRLEPKLNQTNLFAPRRGMIVGVIGGLVLGLALLFSLEPSSFSADSIYSSSSERSLGYLMAVLMGTLMGFILWLLLRKNINPVETLKWSWSEASKHFKIGGWLGIGLGLFTGIVYALVYYQGYNPTAIAILGLIYGVVLGLIFEVILGVISGLLGGLAGSDLESTTTPNQGIWQSTKISIVLALIGVLVLGTGFELIDAPAIAGLSLGLLLGVFRGGEASIKHGLLRIVLVFSGYIPWNYARFLDYATQCILLQKVGGGYIFIHRLLLEHFATMTMATKK